MPAPKITDEQRAAALERAAEARRVRAEIKQLLKTGSLTLEDVFARAEQDDLVGGIKVSSLVVSMPHMGKIKTKRLLEDLRIAEIGYVLLKSDTQHRHLSAVYCAARLSEAFDRLLRHERAHAVVDPPTGQNHLGMIAERFGFVS